MLGPRHFRSWISRLSGLRFRVRPVQTASCSAQTSAPSAFKENASAAAVPRRVSNDAISTNHTFRASLPAARLNRRDAMAAEKEEFGSFLCVHRASAVPLARCSVVAALHCLPAVYPAFDSVALPITVFRLLRNIINRGAWEAFFDERKAAPSRFTSDRFGPGTCPPLRGTARGRRSASRYDRRPARRNISAGWPRHNSVRHGGRESCDRRGCAG